MFERGEWVKGQDNLRIFTGETTANVCFLFQSVHVVGFEGSGFVEMNAPDLDRIASISFAFRTLQSDPLLVLAKGQEPNVR